MDAQELRRLLELAAKAAGIEIEWNVMINPHSPILAPKTQQERNWLGHEHTPWNPAEDDGDALRLACDLGLRVFAVARTESGAACSAVGDVTGERLSEIADMLPTRNATRLAIVRAAAAIGEKMGEDPYGPAAGFNDLTGNEDFLDVSKK